MRRFEGILLVFVMGNDNQLLVTEYFPNSRHQITIHMYSNLIGCLTKYTMAKKIQYHKDVNSSQVKPIKTRLIPIKIPHKKSFMELEN